MVINQQGASSIRLYLVRHQARAVTILFAGRATYLSKIEAADKNIYFQ